VIISQLCGHPHDEKENQIFLIYEAFQSGAVAKSYMRKGFLIYEENSQNPIYEKAVSHIRLCNHAGVMQLHSEFPYK
jgi:hypothetical protein